MERDAPFEMLGFSPKGEMVCAPKPQNPDPADPVFATGPIEIWNPAEGRKLRELGTSEDVVTDIPMLATGTILIRRAGKWLIIDLNDGKVLHDLEAKGRVTWLVPIWGRHRIVFHDDGVLRCRDLDFDRDVWTAEGYSSRCMPIGSRYIRARRDFSIIHGQGVDCYLDSETGEVDPRFARFDQIIVAMESADGKSLLIDTPGRCILCEADSLKERWSMPVDGIEILSFNAAGNQLVADYGDRDGNVTLARWDVATGRVLSPKPLFTELQQGRRTRGLRTHYAIDQLTWRDNGPLVGLAARETVDYRVVDTRTETPVGFIDDLPKRIFPRLAPGGIGVVAVYDERIDYYALPSSDNP
jgi:hypothetical protein